MRVKVEVVAETAQVTDHVPTAGCMGRRAVVCLVVQRLRRSSGHM